MKMIRLGGCGNKVREGEGPTTKEALARSCMESGFVCTSESDSL